MLDDGDARFEDIVESGGTGANNWFHVVIMQGRNRIVRRLWESQGLKVSRLQRVRFGPIVLPRPLRPGAWIELDTAQIESLRNNQQTV
jgi:23S rRNA pseudouridine2605 synthase